MKTAQQTVNTIEPVTNIELPMKQIYEHIRLGVRAVVMKANSKTVYLRIVSSSIPNVKAGQNDRTSVKNFEISWKAIAKAEGK